MSEHFTCPICGNASVDMGHLNSYSMRTCTSCNFAFCATRDVDPAVYEEAYASLPGYESMSRNAAIAAAGTRCLSDLCRYKRKALQWLESRVGVRRLMDVGCGPGEFLFVAKGRGWSVAGIETAHMAAEQARQHGLNVFEGTVEEYSVQSSLQFPAVTCFEVLEHVKDPVGMLSLMRRLLTSDGLIALTVPNSADPYCFRQNDPASLPPLHLNFFNRESLSKAMKRSGLEIVRFWTFPIPTNSARRVLGKNRWLMNIPRLLFKKLCGCSDGTTLAALARRF